MNNKFVRAMRTKDELTENAMPTHSTSENYVLDMFYKLGGARQLSEDEIRTIFAKAFGQDRLLSLRAMFYNRDIRGGQGERRSFRVMFNHLCSNYPELARKLIQFVPEYGRWDDLFVAFGTPVEEAMLDYYTFHLAQGNKLAAKWAPREGKKLDAFAKRFMQFLKFSEKEWRLLLSHNTQVVENLMCSRNWDKIKYETVPSQAMRKYDRAFERHDGGRFIEFLKTGKVHAGAMFPHEVLKPILKRYTASPAQLARIENQWNNLPDWVPDGESFIPVCDVSGSMTGEPMEVSISLGLYLSQRNKGPFKDATITFSTKPRMEVFKSKDILGRVMELSTQDWQMNTDLEAVFRLILNTAVRANLRESDMPSNLLIISDMQFDQCVRNGSDSALEMIDRMYSEHGYKRPNIIFWNVRTSYGVPVKEDENGTALVSGFSPSIIKAVLTRDYDIKEEGAKKEINPVEVMMNVLNSERYSVINL